MYSLHNTCRSSIEQIDQGTLCLNLNQLESFKFDDQLQSAKDEKQNSILPAGPTLKKSRSELTAFF